MTAAGISAAVHDVIAKAGPVRSGRVFSTVLAALIIAISLAVAAEFPAPVGYVSDFAGVLKPETVRELDDALAALKEKTGAEVAVVTVKTLGRLDVNTYAVRLMKEWGIGSKERNDGVLLLVSTGERKLRIEVGYGLEPLITDAKSGMIRDEYLVPRLRENDYDGGLKAGALAIAALIAKERGADLGAAAPQPPPPEAPLRRGRSGGMPPLGVIVFALAILFFLSRSRAGCCLSGFLLGDMLGGGRPGNYGGFGGGLGGGGFSGGFGGGGFGGFGGGFSGGGGASGSF